LKTEAPLPAQAERPVLAQSGRSQACCGVYIEIALAAACCDDHAGPSQDFIVRSPMAEICCEPNGARPGGV